MLRAKDIIVGVDLGGTSMKALVVDAGNKILSVEKLPTRQGRRPATVIADIATLIEKAVYRAGLSRANIRAVSVGAPGAIDQQRGIVHHAPNLGWNEVALGPRLRALLHLPVLVDNDVNVGVVGEHALGAGRGTKELIGVFVGTGIGGGIISRGRLYGGCRGSAGEIGHVVVQVDGPLCPCGRRGCIEALASRTAMERDVRAAIKEGQKSVVLKIMKERNRQRMTSSIIARALKKKDQVMRKVLERAEFHLGILVSNLVNILDPECVVIGGGVTERLGEEFVRPIRETAYFHFLQQSNRERVKIVPGRLGDNAGALGAVVLARQKLES